MTRPLQAMVERVYERDHWTCLRCGTGAGLTIGHRQTGSDPDAPIEALITQCALHNAGAEAWDQEQAHDWGHKVKHSKALKLSEIPVYVHANGLFYLLNTDGTRYPMADAEARARIAFALGR